MCDFRNNAPERYTPGCNTTTPLPAFAAASMAFWIAAVFTVVPSPLAPYAATSNASACRLQSAIVNNGTVDLMRTINNTRLPFPVLSRLGEVWQNTSQGRAANPGQGLPCAIRSVFVVSPKPRRQTLV